MYATKQLRFIHTTFSFFANVRYPPRKTYDESLCFLQICFVSFCSVFIRDNVQYCVHKIIGATEIRDLAQNGVPKNFILAEATSSGNNRGSPFS